MVHVNAQDFPEMRGEILAMSLRILLRTGVTHRDVEKSVRAEVDTSAAVVLRRADDFPQPARRPAGVRERVRRGAAFHDGRRDLSFLKDLVFEVVFSVFSK